MDIHINWIAITVAVIVSLVLAKTWYTEKLFGAPWRKLTGVTPADSKRSGNRPIILTLFANVVTAWALAVLIAMSAKVFGGASVLQAVGVSVVAWLAFSATTLLTHNAFERKPDRLTRINNGYQLLLFVLIGLVIGIFGA